MELANHGRGRAELRKRLIFDLKIAVLVNFTLSLLVVAMVVAILWHPQ
ncbi:MAG TPA: hypothetical protein VMB21_17785 [Candidatus Limnocylindria bacterium]|jgi:hypothetical protein|nr:hypothetical protein [Candidatus Limnocylindria bacterium]